MILEMFSAELKEFRPTNVKQYTILQIARKLNAIHYLRNYLMRAEQHSLKELLRAYRRALSVPDGHSAFLHGLDH